MQAADAHERADRRAEGQPRGTVLHASSIISRPLSSPSRRDGASRRQESGRSPRDAHTPDRAAGASSRAARCARGARSRASRSRAPPLARWSRSTRHSTMARPTETGAAAMRSTRSSTRSARGRGCVWFSMLRVVFEARPDASRRFLFFMSSSMLGRGDRFFFCLGGGVVSFTSFVVVFFGFPFSVVFFCDPSTRLLPGRVSSALDSTIDRSSDRARAAAAAARTRRPRRDRPDDRGAAPDEPSSPDGGAHGRQEANACRPLRMARPPRGLLSSAFGLLPSVFCLRAVSACARFRLRVRARAD